jgi:alcohol oxidase
LARADPTLQILIIESGNDNRNDPLVRTPAFYAHHLKPDSKTAHFHVSKPSPHVAGRSNIVASGQALGGGSSINFMMYTRASASDYDDWNTEGWTFNDLKPLLLKVISPLDVITLDRDVSCATRRS